MFPVGLILKYGVSSPIVHGGRVTGFFDAFQAGRQFAMDMAGFAVSVRQLRSRPEATFPAKVTPTSKTTIQVSFLEEGFVRSLGVAKEELEPRAEQCTRCSSPILNIDPLQGLGVAHKNRESSCTKVSHN